MKKKFLFLKPMFMLLCVFIALASVFVLFSAFKTYGKYRGSAYFIRGRLIAPKIGVRTATTGKKIIKVNGYLFKDSNGNGKLEPYEDWRLSPLKRAQDLAGRMTAEEKIGMLIEFWDFGAPALDSNGIPIIADSVVKAIEEDHIRYSICRWANGVDAAGTAKYYNALQELCEASRLGIPGVVFTDPVHQAGNSETSDQYIGANEAEALTDYPYPIAFAAIDDKALIKKVAREHAAEYRACGVRALLGPQADIATEPMWARVYDTYGTNGIETGRRVMAYIQGLQGLSCGVNPFTGVAATLKHFPGAGANEGGMDSHYVYGMFNVYPGNNFEEHLVAMGIALKANPACIMPCYSIFEDVIYEGVAFEQVASAHANEILDLLHSKFGWNGMITSDWGAVSNRAWGLVNAVDFGAPQNKTIEEIIASYIDAGGHQAGMGFVSDWQSAYDKGYVTFTDLTNCAIKVLEVTFKLGSFENPYANPEKANYIIKSHNKSAIECQLKAMTLLKNEDSVLPIKYNQGVGNFKVQVYFDTIYDDSNNINDTNVLSKYLTMLSRVSYNEYEATSSLNDADYAVIRISARRGSYFGGNGGVPLSFSDIAYGYNQDTNTYDESMPYLRAAPWGTDIDLSYAQAQHELAKIQAAIAAKETNPNLKIIVVMFTPRPAIVTEFIDDIDALLCEFGADDVTVFDMLFQARSDHYKDSTIYTYDTNGNITGIESIIYAIDSIRPDRRLEPRGKLPWNFPSSQAAVYDQYEDIPNDDIAPTFCKGDGMDYHHGYGHGHHHGHGGHGHHHGHGGHGHHHFYY